MVQRGDYVEIWTICGGEADLDQTSPFASQLHQRWGTEEDPVRVRRDEDRDAARLLGVRRRSFPIPDCIYRHSETGEFYYPTEESLFGELDQREKGLMDWLASEITRLIPSDAQLVSPFGVGNHVDHQLTRQAAQAAWSRLWYYADVPYILREPDWRQKWLTGFQPAMRMLLSAKALQHWGDAMMAYRSQISTFWNDETSLRNDLEKLTLQGEGGILWRREVI